MYLIYVQLTQQIYILNLFRSK